MAQIYKMSYVKFAPLVEGEVREITLPVELSTGAIITGLVTESDVGVAGAPVILYEGETAKDYALTDSDGTYLFGVDPVTNKEYTIKTTKSS